MAVRLEKVVLDLDDRFSAPARKAAASAALLHREVDGIDDSAGDAARSSEGLAKSTKGVGDQSERTKGKVRAYTLEMAKADEQAARLRKSLRDQAKAILDQEQGLVSVERELDNTGTSARRAGADIDKFSGRLRLIADAVAILGPGLIPIGAIGIPAVAGLAAQLGAAAIGAGTVVLAFQGVGDTLDAVNKAALEPTADNINAAREAMARLAPETQEFIQAVQDARPAFEGLRDSAAAGLFPGLTQSLGPLVDDVFPRFERILFSVGDAVGGLAVDSADALAGPQWTRFLTFIEENVPSALSELGHAIGNVVGGMAELWMAFDPLNDDFSRWLLGISSAFEGWATGLSETQGFEDFVAYLRETGPQVAETVGALANALLDVLEAAAPLGGPVLAGIEALAKAISVIADSDMGTPIMIAVGALSAFNRLQSVQSRIGATAWAENIRGANGYMNTLATMRSTAIRAGAGLGMMALSMTDVDEKTGLSNTAMGAMLGTMIAPGWGTAIGAVGGGLVDLAAVNDDLAGAVNRADHALESMSTSGLRSAKRELEDVLEKNSQADGLTKWLNDISGDTDDARSALRGVNTALENTGGLEILAQGLGLTTDAFNAATDSAEDFRKSVTQAFAVLDKRASLRAARAALREFTKTLKDAPDDMKKGGPAYDKVEESLDNIARTSLEAAENLKGMNRVNFLDRQRGQFIAAARQLGLTRRQARALATELGLIDKQAVKPKIDADTKPAKGKINEANTWLERYGAKRVNAILDGDNKPARGKIDETNNWLSFLGGRRVNPKIDVTSNAATIAAQTASILNTIDDEIVEIHTVRTGAGGQGKGYDGGADGMTVPGQRWPYGDSKLILTAPGEEIVSNRYGQADRHRELLKAINADRYADGGTVGGRWSVPQMSSRVVERVVERLPREFRVSTDLGDLVLTAVDDRIGDYREADARSAATHWQGVTSD